MTKEIMIKGLQKAQHDNNQRIAALRPSSHFGAAVKDVTIGMHRHAVAITHVWNFKGGGLRASHRMALNGLRGRVYIDKRAVNPRGQRPSVYGPYEEARGGTHAFYSRAVEEAGPALVGAALGKLSRRLV